MFWKTVRSPDLWPLADAAVLAVANLVVWIVHPWLSLSFAWRRRRWPTFATPAAVSELVQWRKVFDRNPLFAVLADKQRVKDWARNKVPGIRTAEVLWSGTVAADIPDELVAPGYVIKTNHGTSTNYFPHRERKPRAEINRQLEAWLAQRFDRELQWAYGQFAPCIIVERLIGDGRALREMTFRCCDGKAVTAYVYNAQKTADEQRACFSGDGERFPHETGLARDRRLPDDFRVGPDFFEARAIAEQLASGLDFVRVDLIWDGPDLYLCEMTLYPDSGFGDEHRTHTAGTIYRAWLGAIERSWFLSTRQSWPLSLYAAAFRRWAAARLQSQVRAIPVSAEGTVS